MTTTRCGGSAAPSSATVSVTAISASGARARTSGASGGEERVGRERPHVLRSGLEQSGRRGGERATRDDHVVTDHDALAAHVADDLRRDRLLVPRSHLGHDREGCVEHASKAARGLDAAEIR